MGYGSYSASDWSKLRQSRNLQADQKVYEVMKRTSCNPKFNPLFIGTRECFDSEDHPHSTPIVVGLDVTASMGYLAVKVATEALNDLILKLYSTNAVEDPALMCAAYGDWRDNSPLQVTQFESDIRIAEQLLDIYFENSGQGCVVPTLLWSFLSRHTNIDAIKKRGEKGFVFTIGDNAKIRETNVGETVKKFIGDNIGNLSAENVLREVEKKFYVFHIMIDNNRGDQPMLRGRQINIDRNDVNIIPEIIIGTIRLQNGVKIEDIIADCDEINRPALRNALGQLSIISTGHGMFL